MSKWCFTDKLDIPVEWPWYCAQCSLYINLVVVLVRIHTYIYLISFSVWRAMSECSAGCLLSSWLALSFLLNNDLFSGCFPWIRNAACLYLRASWNYDIIKPLFVCLMVLYVLLRLFDAAFGSAGDSSLTFSDQAHSRQRHLFKYVNDGGWHHIPVEFLKKIYSKIL